MHTKKIKIAFFYAYDKISSEIFINNENELEINNRLINFCDTYQLISIFETELNINVWQEGVVIQTPLKCIFNSCR